MGGILYTLRNGQPSYTHANKRGDITCKADSTGKITYLTQYQAFGSQEATFGSTLDRQKSNSKDTDPTGLVNEGMRYYSLLTETFITRDPAGMIDGPNEYTYVRQNPWTSFDPEGLQEVPGSPNSPIDANGNLKPTSDFSTQMRSTYNAVGRISAAPVNAGDDIASGDPGRIARGTNTIVKGLQIVKDGLIHALAQFGEGEIGGQVIGKIAKAVVPAADGAKLLPSAAPNIPGPKGQQYILDTNAVITDGKRLVNSGVDVVKPDVFEIDFAGGMRSNPKLFRPKAADKIPYITTKDVNVDSAINVRGGLTPTKAKLTDETKGNVLDGRIGGKAVDSGLPLVTNDQKLMKAVNNAGGTALHPSQVTPPPTSNP